MEAIRSAGVAGVRASIHIEAVMKPRYRAWLTDCAPVLAIPDDEDQARAGIISRQGIILSLLASAVSSFDAGSIGRGNAAIFCAGRILRISMVPHCASLFEVHLVAFCGALGPCAGCEESISRDVMD